MNSRQKDFIYAYKRGPYTAPTQDPGPVASGSHRLISEPPSKRQRASEPAAAEESCPPSPGRIGSIATYTRFSKFHPNTVANRSFKLSFFFGINGAVL
jgi:hypothetical protein